MHATDVMQALQALADPLRADGVARFFKTGLGQYGEGDMFLGVSVPNQRVVAKKFTPLPLSEVLILLQSPCHEFRLTALIILVAKYRAGADAERKAVYNAYLANTRWINNWDLVDSSAEYIVGPQQPPGDSRVLQKLAHSQDIWERRIAMLACFANIKKGQPEPALTIITLLQNDPHDLIQKAVGWMLREIGKRCGRHILLDWLLTDGRYKTLPRTTLRYAIEHFEPADRQAFLKSTV